MTPAVKAVVDAAPPLGREQVAVLRAAGFRSKKDKGPLSGPVVTISTAVTTTATAKATGGRRASSD